MTIDVLLNVDVVENDNAPQGDILSYSIDSSEEEYKDPNSLKVKLRISEKNKIPKVVLRKNYKDEFIVTTKRTPKPKQFEDYETEFCIKESKNANETVSPRKRQLKIPSELESPTKKAVDEVCRALKDDCKLRSPVKVHIIDMNLRPKTPKTSGCYEPQTHKTPRLSRAAKQNLNFNEDDSFIDSLCESINTVNVSTPKKRNAPKTTSEDQQQVSPSKRPTISKSTSGTPRSRRSTRNYESFFPDTEEFSPKKSHNIVTPKRRGRSSKALSPKKQIQDENELIFSANRRVTRTPTRDSSDERSPIRSVTNRLNEFIRTQLFKKKENGSSRKKVLVESTVSNRRSKPTAFEEFEDSLETKRVLRSRSVSLSSNQSEESTEYEPKTPRSSRKKPKSSASTEEAMETDYVLRTPSRRKTQEVASKSVQSTPKTPRNKLKLIREGVITPSMQSRKSTIPANTTPLMKARNQLHVSYVPVDLPCREKEYLNVYNFLQGKLLDQCGGCMYVSGVPGTGKTATVTSVIEKLQKTKGVPKFSYVSVNGMRLTEPKQAYVEIWKQLTGKTRPWEQAQSLLEERFTKKGNSSAVIMLIDELDILCTKRQEVVYNLLDWPSKCMGQLIVITIANTMDLPERLLMNKVTSRLGLTRLTFQPYNHKQLMEIVTKRLTGTDSFNPDAVQLVARKVASVSGDARRALDICRRAAEIAEEEGKTQLVSIAHVDQALNAMITQPKVMAMKRCSRLEKLILQAIVAEVERTGVEETTFADVFKMLVSCCALDGFKMVSSTVAQRAVCQLSSCRLILTDQKCSDIFQKIILNVSVDEVYFALKK